VGGEDDEDRKKDDGAVIEGTAMLRRRRLGLKGADASARCVKSTGEEENGRGRACK